MIRKIKTAAIEVTRRGWSTVTAMTAATVLLVAASVASPAHAASTPEYVSGPIISIAPHGVKYAVATCPSGKVAAGGGYIEPGNSTRNGIVLANSFDPNWPARWLVTVKNDSGSSLELQAQAQCEYAASVRLVSGDVAVVAPHTLKDVFAPCASGEVRRAGGYTQPGNDTQNGIVLVNGFDPNANRWFVRVNNVSSEPLSIRAHVVCVRSNPLIYHSSGAVTTVAPYSVKDLFAYCNSLYFRLGGGFVQHDSPSQKGIVLVSGFDPNWNGRWFVRVKNDSATPINAQAQVSCFEDRIN